MSAGPSDDFKHQVEIYTAGHFLIANPNAADVSIIGLDETTVAIGGNGTTPGQGRMCRAIMLLAAGPLVVTRGDGIDVTLPAATPTGVVIPLQAKGLEATGTACTSVLIMW